MTYRDTAAAARTAHRALLSPVVVTAQKG